jgi:hypothetical protein
MIELATGLDASTEGIHDLARATAGRRLKPLPPLLCAVTNSMNSISSGHRSFNQERIVGECLDELKRPPLSTKAGDGRPLLGSHSSIGNTILEWYGPIWSTLNPGKGTARILELNLEWVKWAERNGGKMISKLHKVFIRYYYAHDAALDKALWGTTELGETAVSRPPKSTSMDEASLKFTGFGQSATLWRDAAKAVHQIRQAGLLADSSDDDPMDVEKPTRQSQQEAAKEKKRKRAADDAKAKAKADAAAKKAKGHPPPPSTPVSTSNFNGPEHANKAYQPRAWGRGVPPAWEKIIKKANEDDRLVELREAGLAGTEVGELPGKAFAGIAIILQEAVRELHPETFKPYFTGVLKKGAPNYCQQACPLGVATTDPLDYCTEFSELTGSKCPCHHDDSGPHKRIPLTAGMRKAVQQRALEICKICKITMPGSQ